MPTRKTSTCFLFLMSSTFSSEVKIGWDAPSVFKRFGINHAPSVDSDDPVPSGLTKDESRLIREFITYIGTQPATERLLLIDSEASDASWQPHRKAWCKWYPKLSGKVNQAVDEVLDELESLPKTMIRQQANDAFPLLDDFCNAVNDACTELFGAAMSNGRFLWRDARLAGKMFFVQMYSRHKKNWKKALTVLHGKVNAKGTPEEPGAGLWPALVAHMSGPWFLPFVSFTYSPFVQKWRRRMFGTTQLFWRPSR